MTDTFEFFLGKYLLETLNLYGMFNHLLDYCTNYDNHNLSLTTTGASAVKESYEKFGLSIT